MPDVIMKSDVETSGSSVIKVEATSPTEIKNIAVAHPQTPSLQDALPAETTLSPEHQRIHRNHSFQLVRLQSEVSSLKAQREKDFKHMEALQEQMTKLYVDLANAKGVMGRIRIECHSRGHGTSSSSVKNAVTAATASHVSPSGNAGDILERVKNAKGDIEGLADAILEEQRPKLITGLTALNSVVDNWTLEKRMRGNVDRLVSIYTKEEEDKENVPPADEF